MVVVGATDSAAAASAVLKAFLVLELETAVAIAAAVPVPERQLVISFVGAKYSVAGTPRQQVLS